MNNQDPSGYVLISWIALLVGWFFALSIIAFPIGIWAANKGARLGGDTSLVRLLNIVSLVFVILGFIFITLVSGLFML